jgi:hypothetical protein
MKFTLENIFNIDQLKKHLTSGLQRLKLQDNFEGEEIQVLIPAGQEVRVRNPLNFIPSRYILISKSGNSTISRSNIWTQDYVYFTNFGPENSDTIIFLTRN